MPQGDWAFWALFRPFQHFGDANFSLSETPFALDGKTSNENPDGQDPAVLGRCRCRAHKVG
jgi:hypothetical protein